MKHIAFPCESFDHPTGGGISALSIIHGIDPARFTPVVLFPEPCLVSEELAQQGMTVKIWPLHDPHGLWQYAWDILRSIRFLRQQQIDLIHFNHLGYWKPAEILAARLLRIPIITHLRLIRTSPAPFLKFSQVIIANSQFTARASGVPAGKTRIVYNAVDLDKFTTGRSLRQELGIAPEAIVLGFIGSLKPIKGIEMFLDLADAFHKPELIFLVVGNSDDAGYLDALTRRMAQQDNVIYTGYRRDVENIYATADIFVMPSQIDESFGRINIEAGAAGKPMIATRVGGIPEIIQHGENGYLVEKHDTEALKQYAEQLIENELLRKRMGARGRDIVAAKFSTTTHLKAIEKIYDTLLQSA